MNTQGLHKRRLIQILQMAYSGELAAALAYAGHWRSVGKEEQRADIARIEQDEWEHRAIVGRMLDELGASPQPFRELLMGCLGSTIFLACFVSGWFFPMYFAGRLEHANVDEYGEAARHAAALGLSEYELELLRLSAIEQAHEDYFKEQVRGHRLTPLMADVFHWGAASQTTGYRPAHILRAQATGRAVTAQTSALRSGE